MSGRAQHYVVFGWEDDQPVGNLQALLQRKATGPARKSIR
jgi:hypothetical protein